MDEDYLKECVDKDMSISQIANVNGKSSTSVRYWLTKFKLKTNHKSFKDKGVIDYGDNKYCPRCDSDKEIGEFYQKRGKIGGSNYCKKCSSEQVLERQRKYKKDCISYKGGECEKCGYKKCEGALEFHHLDPSKKDFTIAKAKLKKFDDKIKKELDKCIMVCANCHREIHANINNPIIQVRVLVGVLKL